MTGASARGERAEDGAPPEQGRGADPHDYRPAGFQPPSIAAGGIDAMLFRAVELVARVLLVIVTGRLMEPTGRGLYALAALCSNLSSVPFGSIWVANAVELARRRATLRELLGASIVLGMAGGLLTGLLGVAIAPLFGDRWWVVALPAVVTPFLLLARYFEGLYTSIGHIRAVNLIRVGRAVLPVLFITPPLLAGASARLAIAIWTLAIVVLPALTWLPLRRLVGTPKLPKERSLYRRVVSYGLKISGLGVVPVLNERVALLALAAFASAAAVGVYSIAVAATEVLILGTQALALSAFRRIGTSSPEASAALTARTMRHSWVLTAVGSVLLIPGVALALPWTVGPGYEEVPVLLAILVPAVMGFAGMSPLYNFFSVQAARPAVLLTATVPALISNIALTVALTPMWGTRGAATAASLAAIVAMAIGVRCFLAESGMRLADLRPGRQELADYRALAGSFARRWRQRS